MRGLLGLVNHGWAWLLAFLRAVGPWIGAPVISICSTAIGHRFAFRWRRWIAETFTERIAHSAPSDLRCMHTVESLYRYYWCWGRGGRGFALSDFAFSFPNFLNCDRQQSALSNKLKPALAFAHAGPSFSISLAQTAVNEVYR